jgi:peroxin-14
VVVQKEAVENAVRFLNHPKVQSSPLGKRMAFLKHKGLNDAEIALALKHANITPRYDIKRAIWSSPTPLPPPPPPPPPPPLRPLLPLYPLSVRPF